MKNKLVTAHHLLLALLCLVVRLYPEPQRSILAHLDPKNGSAQTTKSSEKKRSAPPTPPVKVAQRPTKKEEGQKQISIPKMPTPPSQAPRISRAKPEPEKKEEELPEKEPSQAEPINREQATDLKKAKTSEQDSQKIRFYFEDATLANVVKYMETLFNITFLPDDAIKPLISGAVPLEGHKISFKTNRALSRQEAWNVFLRLLDLSGLTLVPGATQDFYRITSIHGANQEPLPTYFDTQADAIPDNTTKVRYIYFVKNNPLATIQNVATSLKSTTATVLPFSDLDALIITDKGSNLRSLMKIIQEFDKNMPEAMSILKLRRTDAAQVAQLYGALTKSEGVQNPSRYLQQRKQPGSLYFPADVRIIPEPRTNSLILLGPKRALEKIENFIIKHIDTELDMPYSPLHVYHLQSTSASNIAGILEKVIAFGSGTPPGQVGGIRDGQKYFKSGSISMTPEPIGNKLIIRAEQEDYEKLKEIIRVLDVDQPQVAIEALIVDVTATNTKQLNVQLRNKSDGSVVDDVNFQSAQISQAQVANDGGLLGNLIGLASGDKNPVGTTLLSVGSAAANGIWGLFRILKTYTDAKIIENPFLLATNKYQASFSFGKTRRVLTATVGSGTSSFGDKEANLTLKVTPQINTDGIITMDIDLTIKDFTNESDVDAATTNKQITTSVHVKDQEVLILGGITKNTISNTVTKVPLLGDIPLLGTLFRGKSKAHIRSNLLIFISPKIISPSYDYHIEHYTHSRAEEARGTINTMTDSAGSRDPIERAFFDSSSKHGVERDYLDSFNEFMAPDLDAPVTASNPAQTAPTRPAGPSYKRLAQKKRLARRRRA